MDIDWALDRLRRVVKGREDYVYERIGSVGGVGGMCAYFTPDGKPSCIVGHALAIEGLTLDEVGGENTASVETLDEHLQATGRWWGLTPGAVEVLAVAQQSQDTGETWGEALRCAEEAARHSGLK